MQIAVVEIPTKETDGYGEVPAVGQLGDWGLEPNPGGLFEPGSALPGAPRASGVFPAVRRADDWTSANDVWRWVPPPPAGAPEGCVRLVVFQRGATWPPFLARDLSDGVTTCILSEGLGDGLSGLTQRAIRRASHVNLPVTQLIWISGDTRRSAPVRFVRQLAESVKAAATVLVVQAHAPSSRRRPYRRRGVVAPPAPATEAPRWAVVATGSG
jgi:hypothetical protein